MAQEQTLAPWAELVPGREHMTVDELLALPDDAQWQYELVEGRLVRMPGPGGEHGEVAANLLIALGVFVQTHKLGRVLAAETGFQLDRDTVLGADVAFVHADRVPPRDDTARVKYWRLAPDLVAEVASPSQKRDAMGTKARAWLAAGTRLVWIAWPDSQQVDVWRLTDTGSARPTKTLGISDALDGLDVLPGFTYPLAELFA